MTDHTIGKGEVGSSILLGSTSKLNNLTDARLANHASNAHGTVNELRPSCDTGLTQEQIANEDPVARWRRERDEACERRADFGTVAAMADKLGVPKWHIYKTVLTELEGHILEAHKGAPRRERIGDLIAECLAYAKHCTRVDGFKAVWRSRSLEFIRDAAKELFQP